MRLCWLTDIHLDFLRASGPREFATSVAEHEADLVIVSGDIAIAPTIIDTLDLLAENVGSPLAYVLGNHDFYRGSVADIRARCAAHDAATYLHGRAPIALTETTGMVGVDGWGDGRFGRPRESDLVFTDWAVIEEFTRVRAVEDIDARLRVLHQLGDESATQLAASLQAAVVRFQHVIIVTHVPPFARAAGDNGSNMANLWTPWLGCAATGAVIERFADAHRNVTFEVLCGHTHVARVVHPRPNVVSRTGAATYRAPEVQRVWDVP